MAIVGAHVLIYTRKADELRATFSDVLGWSAVDAGDGWLIFALPPAEVAAHPTEGESRHVLSLMCDDIDATMAELRAKGIRFTREPVDEGWGIATTMLLPGEVEVQLYEPRDPTAIEGRG